MKNNTTLFILLAVFVAAVLFFYYFLDPQSTGFLLKCPFKYFTGYDCPGCGSQRALHEILHGNFAQALSYNPLFVIFIPYVFTGIIFGWFGLKYKYPKMRKFLFGAPAIYFIAVLIIAFFIIRNT